MTKKRRAQIVAKFLVDRLLCNMEDAAEVEAFLALGSRLQVGAEFIPASLRDTLSSPPYTLSTDELKAVMQRLNIPDDYCDWTFDERADQWHRMV